MEVTLLIIISHPQYTAMDVTQNISERHTNLLTHDKDGLLAPIVSSVYLRLSNTIASAAFSVNFIHMVVLAIKPKSKRLRAQNFKVMLMTVALCDFLLLTGQLVLNHHVIQQVLFHVHWICVVTATLKHSLVIFEPCLFLVMSLEIFVTLRFPDKYRKALSTKKLVLFLFIIFTIIFTFSGCMAGVYYGQAFSTRGFGSCSLSSKQMPKLGVGSTLLGLSVLASFLLSSILTIAKISSIESKTSMVCLRNSPLRHKKAAVTIGLLAAAKILCWTPSFVSIIVSCLTDNSSNTILSCSAELILTLFPITTPVIYFCTSQDHRRFIIKTLTRKSNNTVTPSPVIPRRIAVLDRLALPPNRTHGNPRRTSQISVMTVSQSIASISWLY